MTLIKNKTPNKQLSTRTAIRPHARPRGKRNESRRAHRTSLAGPPTPPSE